MLRCPIHQLSSDPLTHLMPPFSRQGPYGDAPQANKSSHGGFLSTLDTMIVDFITMIVDFIRF